MNEGDIAVLGSRRRSPYAGDLRAAIETSALAIDTVLDHVESAAANYGCMTAGTMRVFQFAHFARQISGIDESQADVAGNPGGAYQIGGASAGLLCHSIVRVEGGKVPGDIGRDAGDESRGRREFLEGIVEPRHDQRNDLHPEAHGVDVSDGVEDRREAASQLAIALFAEALQVDLDDFEAGAEIPQDLRCGVTVRNEASEQPGLVRDAEDFSGPFRRDQRLLT